MQNSIALPVTGTVSGLENNQKANEALESLATNFLGPDAPDPTYPGQCWADTTAGWLKQRNAADSAWDKKYPLGTGARVDVASAATIDLDAAAVTSDYIRLTGTTEVTAVTLAAGQRRLAVAGGVVPITHGASLILPGAADYTCATGDLLLFVGEAAGVVRVMIWKGDGTPVIGGIPQNSKSAAYTTVLSDAGKHLLHPSADTTARIFTIDSNANVPYPVGTAITFVNQAGAGVMTIAITSDTMRLAGAGTTGSRTLAANGVATALKLTATEWIISGTGLT